MEIVEGGVYKCGKGFVRIIKNLSEEDYHDPTYKSYVGMSCNSEGHTYRCNFNLGVFGKEGEYGMNNPLSLQSNLEEIKPRETISIAGKLYDKEEFEIAVANLKEVN
jgi:hypothetical protein